MPARVHITQAVHQFPVFFRSIGRSRYLRQPFPEHLVQRLMLFAGDLPRAIDKVIFGT